MRRAIMTLSLVALTACGSPQAFSEEEKANVANMTSLDYLAGQMTEADQAPSMSSEERIQEPISEWYDEGSEPEAPADAPGNGWGE